MTRKDYQQIAVAVRTLLRDVDNYTPRDAVGMFVEQLCSVMKQDNRAFDKARFMEACGL